ncbi:hypothetical protein M432DRAFT_247861 [Thermoascus aurantiacus ATCC 26904]
MASTLYYLNRPTHPFWDFVASLEDLPFSQYFHPPPYPSHEDVRGRAQAHEQFRNRENSVQGEAPPAEAREGPSSQQDQSVPGLGEHPEEQSSDPLGRDRRRHGHRVRSGGRRGFDRHEHPFGWHPAGPGWGCHRGGHRPWGHHHRGHFRHGPVDFDWLAFLERMASQLGINLDQMYSNRRPHNENVDFVPPVDIFDAPNEFLVHVSIPGARKSDVSVEYDAGNSTLHVAGVVYRPGIDEQLNNTLVVEERAREVGVFEREVRLGTRAQPANVDIDGVSAKLVEGVLVVSLPKIVVDPERLRRRVSVEDLSGDGHEQGGADRPDEMYVDSNTERGDTEVGQLTPSRDSAFSDIEAEGKEYVTVNVQ